MTVSTLDWRGCTLVRIPNGIYRTTESERRKATASEDGRVG